MHSAPRPALPPSRRFAHGLALVLAGLIWLAYVLLPLPLPGFARTAIYQATALSAVPFAVVLAYGFSVIVTLIRANRRRMRAVLRPNLGRILGAVALMLVTPLVVMNWYPWILGGMAPFFLAQLFGPD